MSNKPSPSNWPKWFDPRRREAGTWAFILNRLSALGLTFYLFLHLIVLGTLAQGEAAYDNFLETIHNPLFILGELVVIVGAVYHGLNGLRVGLTSFGIGVSVQKQLFYITLAITAVAALVFAVRMFS